MTELGRLYVCICVCISREGMSSDRAREATCAMFVNIPTGPTTATVQQSIWDFQCRAFSRPQTLYSLLLSPSSKAKKGNMNRVQKVVHTFLWDGVKVYEV